MNLLLLLQQPWYSLSCGYVAANVCRNSVVETILFYYDSVWSKS